MRTNLARRRLPILPRQRCEQYFCQVFFGLNSARQRRLLHFLSSNGSGYMTPPSCVLVRTRYTDGEIVSRKKIQKIFGEKKRRVSPSGLSVKRYKDRSCARLGPAGPTWNWRVETRLRASPGAESLQSST